MQVKLAAIGGTAISETELERIPTTEGESPGMGKAIASFFVPGAGPVIASGIVGAALLIALAEDESAS